MKKEVIEIEKYIKRNYLIIIDNDSDERTRLESANNIVFGILKYELKKGKRLKFFKNSYRKLDTKNPFYLNDFLVNYNYIPKTYEHLNELILSLGNPREIKKYSSEINNETLDAIHKSINVLLKWFLKKENISSSFLLPIEIIPENNKYLQKYKQNRITTFLNIRNSAQIKIQKYKTIFSYFIIIFPVLFFAPLLINDHVIDINIDNMYRNITDNDLSVLFIIYLVVYLITSAVGLYKTYVYVEGKYLKIIRYFIYSFYLLLLIGLSTNKLLDFNILPESEGYGFLQPNPIINFHGFAYITPIHDKSKYFKFIDRRDYPVDDDLFFQLNVEIKNLSNMELKNINLYTNLIYTIDNELNIGLNCSYVDYPFKDIVTIQNLNTYDSIYFLKEEIKYIVKDTDSLGNVFYKDSLLMQTNFNPKISSDFISKLPSIKPITDKRVERMIVTYLLHLKNTNEK